MDEMWTDAVGWFSAAILLATLVTQIAAQWRDKSGKGVSPWLFVGQLAASVGFIVYSVLTRNVVFIVTNTLIATVALFGQYTYYRNRRITKKLRRPFHNPWANTQVRMQNRLIAKQSDR